MTALDIAFQQAGSRLRRVDRVWLALGLLFAALALITPPQALESARFTLDAFLWILPFMVVSVALAAGLKAVGADKLIGSAVSRRPASMILLAALFGALSPFCSCGVVPLVAALLAAGMPLAAVLAFCLASPIMDPEMFVLMAVAIDLPFTLAKTVAAVGMGVMAGFATLALQRAGFFAAPLRDGVSGGCAAGAAAPSALHWSFWREPGRRQIFAGEAKSVSLFLAKWLMLAFALESLMVAWVPGELVASTLGGTGWSAIPLAVLVGVPAYLNGYAAIPLIGELMELGMAPGAALAFMVAGGVTSLPAAMAVYALVKRPVFLWYLALSLVGSLAVGFAYQGFLAVIG